MKKFYRRILLALLLATVCTGVGVDQALSRDSVLGEVSLNREKEGPYAVGRQDMTLVDTARPTSPNKGYAGAPTRTLKTTVWYPAAPRACEGVTPGPAPVAQGNFPLLIYSHGFMSFREEGTYLAKYLASYGYVVVAANFPLTNYFAPGGPRLTDMPNQPGDVSFLITSALGWNADSTHPFFQRLDAERIAVAGVSLGGMTSTLAAFHPTLRDKRIKVAISLAGPAGMFAPEFYDHANVPFLMVAGKLDVIVPYAAHAALVPERNPRATLVTLLRGSHVNFADIARILFRWTDNPEPAGCKQIKKNLNTQDDFLGPLGGTAAGILPLTPEAIPCQATTFPTALRPGVQQDLTRLAVYAFLQGHFDPDTADRVTARQYLYTLLPKENPEVVVTAPRPDHTAP